jgi:aminoglycoside/choline kinase family phosphotransferase
MAAVDPTPPKNPQALPDEALIAQTVRLKLPFRAEVVKLAPLAGDASNRRYFRVELSGGSPGSLILMQLAEPEAFKQSEEAVSGATVPITELPFVNILNHLLKADVSVPVLYHYDQAAGLLYLQDFGDTTLTEACRQAAPSELTQRYRDAIDTLVRIQTVATVPANPGCLAFHRGFDVPLLMWEFDHFLEYGVVARCGRPMCAEDLQPVRAEFLKIAELLAAQPRVFTHRDYHSRNLMVEGRRLGVLDFQDALMGPPAYDLASLLRDAYLALDELLIDELIAYYLDCMARQGTTGLDRGTFRRLFDLTSLQRNLKAAGRFVYIDRVKQNQKFLADIPRTLGYVRRNLAKYPELNTLWKHLVPYVPELR